MNNWMNVKVKYAAEDIHGRLCNVVDDYLIDAMSFIEAETRMNKELDGEVKGGHYVMAITKSNISEVFRYEERVDTPYYKVKIAYALTDADTAKSKKITQYFLVEANNIKEAYDRIHDSLHNMLVSFDVVDITSSRVVDVYNYEGQGDGGD